MSISQENITEKISLSEKDKKFMQEWEQWKQKGFWRFILFNGISWGLLTGITLALVTYSIRGIYEGWQSILLQILVFTMGGIISFAPTMWYINERKYKFLKKKGNE